MDISIFFKNEKKIKTKKIKKNNKYNEILKTLVKKK